MEMSQAVSTPDLPSKDVPICRDCEVHREDFNFAHLKLGQSPCGICNQMDTSCRNGEERTYVCSICEYTNRSLSNLRIHMMKHSGDHLADCRFCSRTFYSKKACREHELSKHSLAGSRLKSKFLKRKRRLKLSSCNGKNTNYQCEMCGWTYSSWKGIQRHRMVAHQGQEYQCDVCDKRLKSLDSLKNHLLIHRGEKRYTCATCEKQFRTRNGLVVHVRIHTGAKPFKCQICERSFSQSSSLKVHIRYHNGDRPFQCELCGKKYVTASLLRKHVESSH
ncbi:IKAROS family zinc finger 5 (Pegasus) [Nesidiocoris tenuis]|uniref:IKAROS family zinc finger 5 (Pegasus) n=1 Tax=Nesidiocoris tenuis TaxID=355587 RepID=A0ABN7ASN7_9HEMI|nr:IKAROS family zinc finger 5 (Pegasus) [Nesidiocoris tenuis]